MSQTPSTSGSVNSGVACEHSSGTQHTPEQLAAAVALLRGGMAYPDAAGAIAERDGLVVPALMSLMGATKDAAEADARDAFRAKADRGGFRHVSSMGRV